MTWKGWLALLVSIWLIISAFVPALLAPWNFAIVGILFVIAGFSMIPDGSKWQGWLIGLIGIWLFIAAFIAGTHTLSHCLILGILVFIFSLTARKKD